MIQTKDIVTRVGSPETSELRCPRCASFFIRHMGVTVWERSEDAETVKRTEVRPDGVNVVFADAGDGNPSDRRHGLAISFSCEECGGDTIELCIAQHKGVTQISWRYDPIA